MDNTDEEHEVSDGEITDYKATDVVSQVRRHVRVLKSKQYAETDEEYRMVHKYSIQFLSELAKNEDIVNLIIESGAVRALVQHLQAPQWKDDVEEPKPVEHEVEKGSAFTLGLLAIKPEHQQLIVDAGALPHLVALLKRHRDGQNSRAVNGVIRRAADAITNLAHENSSIKTRVRVEGGIPPLVELLEFTDAKVQIAAAGALRTLALKNDENKTQIVDCNALPTLILMLRSEDTAIHYEAVGVIRNLVHSSPNIKKEVLIVGALQPVIELLSSSCSESQCEAALLLGQFAAADSDCKVHIVQRGAVGPLVEMLQSPDAQLREMSAFVLGRLAQDTHNQAGIAHGGGIPPLLKLLDSRNGSLQHKAAFALYGLADNEDNVADLIRVGVVQKLQDGEFILQPTRDCVAKTLKRLEEKIHGRVIISRKMIGKPNYVPANSVRRSLKRKHEYEFINITTSSDDITITQDLLSQVTLQVQILESEQDDEDDDDYRFVVKCAIHILSELAKNEDIVNLIVESGGVRALVRHLQAPQWKDDVEEPRPHEHEVEKGSAFTLGLLAIKPEHQQLIVDAGALPHLVALLKRHRDGQKSRAVNGVIRRAADAITKLAHENSSITTRVRVEGGIPPLVELLEFTDAKVQRAAAGALRTLAFKNDVNKIQIVDCNALPTLILMLRSEDAAIHYEAVGVIGNLVHSSPNIKKEVLIAGALQPVIELLRY